ncbi:MAG: hypothetical protein HGA62_07640 [Chlorobiaceae bacterium]|nr:hypothetical protein [Chlorobiaceae bacterium]NTV61779.1 hypothetical protein [Chlorobiaceae bacterium]
MAKTTISSPRGLVASILFVCAMLFASDSFAVGENAGSVRSSSIRLLRTEGNVDIMRATVIVESGADGCGPYTVSLFMSRTGSESHSVGSDRGTAMAPGMNRAHSMTIRKKHWPGMRYLISGFVNWGPDAQIPIPEVRFEDPPPVRH